MKVRWKGLVEKYGRPVEIGGDVRIEPDSGVVTIHVGQGPNDAWYGEFGHTVVNVVTRVTFGRPITVPQGPSIIVGIDMRDVIPLSPLPSGTKVHVKSEHFENECDAVIMESKQHEYDGEVQGLLYRVEVTSGQPIDEYVLENGELWVLDNEVHAI